MYDVRLRNAAQMSQAMSTGGETYEVRLGVTGFVVEGRGKDGDGFTIIYSSTIGYSSVINGTHDPLPAALRYVRSMLKSRL